MKDRTFGLSKNTYGHVRSRMTIFFSIFANHRIRPQVQWAVSLVTANGHYPSSELYVGMYELTCSLYPSGDSKQNEPVIPGHT